MINRNFKDFKFQHKRNLNQVLFTSEKINDDSEILNLIDNFLNEKNSFIFESVEKGIIKGRYTIFDSKWLEKTCKNIASNPYFIYNFELFDRRYLNVNGITRPRHLFIFLP